MPFEQRSTEESRVTVPVPFFLIGHPRGKVLFDTGNGMGAALDPVAHWGDAARAYYPRMNESDFVVNQLRDLGIAPEDIDLVILSHPHLDHAGGVGCFPHARYVVQRMDDHFGVFGDGRLVHPRPYAGTSIPAGATIRKRGFSAVRRLLLHRGNPR